MTNQNIKIVQPVLESLLCIQDMRCQTDKTPKHPIMNDSIDSPPLPHINKLVYTKRKSQNPSSMLIFDSYSVILIFDFLSLTSIAIQLSYERTNKKPAPDHLHPEQAVITPC